MTMKTVSYAVTFLIVIMVVLSSLAVFVHGDDEDTIFRGRDDPDNDPDPDNPTQDNTTLNDRDHVLDDDSLEKYADYDDHVKNNYWLSSGEGHVEMHRVQYRSGYVRRMCFEFHANESVWLGMEHSVGSRGEDVIFGFRVQPLAVIEFLDRNGDGAYDPLTDRDVSSISLEAERGQNPFAPVQVRETEVNGNTLNIMEAATLDGHFRLRLYRSEVNLTIGNMRLGPERVKFDMEILDYPFKRDDTRVAVVMSFMQMEGHGAEYVGENTGVIVHGLDGRVRGGFSWLGNATVDDRDTPVTATAFIDNGNVVGMAFSYERGGRIVHDPLLEIDAYSDDFPPEPSSVSALNASLGTFLVAAVASLVVLAVMRRAGKR